MSDEAPAIGIDLGTTNSCAAVLLDDQITLIHGDDGSNTTASFVFFENSGSRLVGNFAKDRACRNPKNGIYGVKRFIGCTYDEFKSRKPLSMFPYTVENKDNKPTIIVKCKEKTMDFTPEEISAMVLTKLKERAEEILMKKVTKAVITVPAHFNGTQRQATIDAGHIAGLKVLRVINEPTAAILAFDIHRRHKDKECNVLVYDFGGGTFDVSIATVNKEEIQVKASNGEAFLGGDDLNNNLIEYFIERFRKEHDVDLKESLKAVERLRQQAEIAKKTLSQAYEHEVQIDCITDDSNLDFEFTISRSVFQNINANIFEKTLKCIEKTLEEANMKKEEIDEILLVGGSTRIPYVRNIVKEYFGKEPNSSIHPDEAVAIGAAKQAAKSGGKNYCKELTKMKLSDICSLSLGIETMGDIMDVVIPRNTKIPTKNKRSYETTYDNQTGIAMDIYEGERTMTTDNKFLSKFELSGIKLAPAGCVIADVTFEINESGILTATAEERSSNNSSKIEVSIYKNNLSELEVKSMIEKANNFKKIDEDKKAIALLKNILDEKCNKYKNKVLKLENISTDDKYEILRICNEISNWMESNVNFNKIDTENKIKELDKCTEIFNKYM